MFLKGHEKTIELWCKGYVSTHLGCALGCSWGWGWYLAVQNRAQRRVQRRASVSSPSSQSLRRSGTWWKVLEPYNICCVDVLFLPPQHFPCLPCLPPCLTCFAKFLRRVATNRKYCTSGQNAVEKRNRNMNGIFKSLILLSCCFYKQVQKIRPLLDTLDLQILQPQTVQFCNFWKGQGRRLYSYLLVGETTC